VIKKNMISSNTLQVLMSLLQEIGVDEIISPSPHNRFKEKNVERKSKAPSSSTSEPSSSASSFAPPVSRKELSEAACIAAQSANSLEELRKALEGFEGCSLKHTAINLVFGDGNPKARVMLIGEAPGADEDRQGLPFVGQSGQLLDKALSAIGLTRRNFYITNIIPWRPPGNRQPTTQETEACLPFVKRHIDLVSPDFLILVGGTSAKALLGGRDGIMRSRGLWKDYRSEAGKKIKVISIFHPAYLLRSPGQKREFWLDLIKIKKSLLEAEVKLEDGA
jgi:DNA polymerase